MKRTALIATLAVAGAAQAQVPGQFAMPQGLRLRAGVALPVDEDLRQYGRSFFGFGLDYELSDSFIPMSTSYLSADWMFNTSQGDKGNIFPIMLNQRFYAGPVANAVVGSRPYFFAGLGVVILDANGSSMLLGGRAGLGVEFGDRMFGEVSVVVSARASNSGASASIAAK